MGRYAIPLVDGKKQCRGKNGCGQWKELTTFPKQFGYYSSHCKECEKKRQTKMREDKKKYSIDRIQKG